MDALQRRIQVDDVLALEVAVPKGHQHLRAVLDLRDGSRLELQEATLAALARAYVRIKADPLCTGVVFRGRELAPDEGKPGFARWQLLDEV